MSRTKGSRDRKQRKHRSVRRSDYGKKRKLFKGKPPKGKRQIKSERKIKNNGILKVWVWQRISRTPESAMKFNARVRPFMARHPITAFRMRHDLPVDEINTKEKIELFFEENYWEGDFYLMGFSHGKNKYHVKPVKICEVLVRETNDGLKARMIQNFRLSRYKWFYRG
jgi:hypothetical protein